MYLWQISFNVRSIMIWFVKIHPSLVEHFLSVSSENVVILNKDRDCCVPTYHWIAKSCQKPSDYEIEQFDFNSIKFTFWLLSCWVNCWMGGIRFASFIWRNIISCKQALSEGNIDTTSASTFVIAPANKKKNFGKT